MTAVLTSTLHSVAPAAAQSGLPIAVSIALGVTAVVALGMALIELRRSPRRTAIAGGIGAASAAAVIALSISLTVGASAATPEAPAAVVPLQVTDYALENSQLATLAVD